MSDFKIFFLSVTNSYIEPPSTVTLTVTLTVTDRYTSH